MKIAISMCACHPGQELLAQAMRESQEMASDDNDGTETLQNHIKEPVEQRFNPMLMLTIRSNVCSTPSLKRC